MAAARAAAAPGNGTNRRNTREQHSYQVTFDIHSATDPEQIETSIADAAPIAWPSIDLIELRGGASSPVKTRLTATASTRSLERVPVPWAQM